MTFYAVVGGGGCVLKLCDVPLRPLCLQHYSNPFVFCRFVWDGLYLNRILLIWSIWKYREYMEQAVARKVEESGT